jgi:DNA-directed RNA polymerase specialized sigma24 family protein
MLHWTLPPTQHQPLADLIPSIQSAVRDADQPAIERRFRRLENAVRHEHRGLCARYTGAGLSTEEALQAILVALHRALTSPAGCAVDNPAAWARTCAENALRDELRKLRTVRQRHDSWEPEKLEKVCDQSGMFDMFELQACHEEEQRHAELCESLGKYVAEYAETTTPANAVLIQTWFDLCVSKRTTDEVAHAYGLSGLRNGGADAVWQRKHRGAAELLRLASLDDDAERAAIVTRAVKTLSARPGPAEAMTG